MSVVGVNNKMPVVLYKRCWRNVLRRILHWPRLGVSDSPVILYIVAYVAALITLKWVLERMMVKSIPCIFNYRAVTEKRSTRLFRKPYVDTANQSSSRNITGKHRVDGTLDANER